MVRMQKTEEKPLTERQQAAHLLSRLAFGPRPGQVDEVLRTGLDRWVTAQLDPSRIPTPGLNDRLAAFQTLAMTPRDLREAFLALRKENPTPEEIKARNLKKRQPKIELLQSILLRAVYSPRQLQEVLCNFWRNHFNVSYTKGGPVDFFIPDYERTVVQAHALGTFEELLFASAKHPAMLYYLDNALSRRPATKAELSKIKEAARERTGSKVRAEEAVELASQRGLNENYARELMELHTLGVDNFYHQSDVVQVAEALTGWTIDYQGENAEYGFLFRPYLHVDGAKKVLGRIFREKKLRDAVREGEGVLTMLAHHRGTAAFLSRKLCTYFVSDDPAKKSVDKTAAAFLKSGGDVRVLLASIVGGPGFYAPGNFRAKFKTPFELVVSALRAVSAEVSNSLPLLKKLDEMGEPVYHCDPPTGYSDRAEAWLDPGVMALRWQFAVDLAEGRIPGVRIPESFHAGMEEQPAPLWQKILTNKVLPGGVGERTRHALTAITDDYLSKSRRPRLDRLGPQLLGLLLGSPEFQSQ